MMEPATVLIPVLRTLNTFSELGINALVRNTSKDVHGQVLCFEAWSPMENVVPEGKPLATHLTVAVVLLCGDKQAHQEQWPILFLQGHASWARLTRQGAILVTFQEGYE